MRVYNTLSKRKEEFVTLEPGKVKMYVCGPTVYNLIHIGNARPMIVFDTVRRYLEHKGYEVNYVSNFTDVDDKIIAKANEEGVSSQEISERYIAECKKDMEALNVRPATTHPRATQEIDGMIAMIQTLVDKGFAYDVDGTVYFRTRKFQEYGKLSHKNLDDLRSGNRSLLVTGEDQKEDPLDFVLWKPKKEGEPSWPSPWSDGRPGWHIECSVMSKKYLGEQIDIHAGGEDLIFPHHENEIAQSECCNGKEFAKYWLHNAFLNIDNRKMSKSLGNFFTVREILEKYDPQVLRFFMLSAHYRSPLNFSADLMEAAKNGLDRIRNAVSNLKYLMECGAPAGDQSGSAAPNAAGGKQDSISRDADSGMTTEEEGLLAAIKAYEVKFDEAMDDDFNTADAIAVIFELVKFANSNLSSGNSRVLLQAVYDEIVRLSDILGLIVEEKEELLDADIEALIAERQAARKAKNFARADEIRNQLADQGITLLDTREGVKWKRA
ncbi:MAG: cysteine--tRNA ligase [Lachnospiraceae bacterium]|nr:cysteine--tRNA ligase [Lachnospiraceae bacterium]